MKVAGYAGSMVWVAVAGILVCVTGFSPAAEEQPPDVKLKIETLSLFKNGIGFIKSGAKLPEKANTVRFGQLPVPSYGTFWLGYSDRVKVRSLITSMETVEELSDVTNMDQFLQANAGRKVLIRTSSDDDVEGVIMKTGDESNTKEPPSPYFMDIRRIQDPYGRYDSFNPGTPAFALVKTAKGTVALNSGSISRAELEGEKVNHVIKTSQKRPGIRLELEKPAGGEKVSVSYLARGVTWVPSYLVDLSDGKTAKLSAKAVIINELADFDKVKLELVTGFPNIKFGELLSPMAMSQNLADFLTSLAKGRTESAEGGRHGGMMMQQAFALSSNVSGYDTENAPLPNYSTAAEGTLSEDLFLYPVKEFSLKKGETACIPLFTAEMPYKHIYTWKIADFLDKDERYHSDEQGEDNKKPGEEVWHSCRLVNSLKMPLTTAAAEFVKDGQFTGQDICYFTAPGAETTIRINRAMNVVAEQAEMEKERKRSAAQFYGYNYDLVTVKGELKVKNRQDKVVNIEITKELSGEVVENPANAKDIQTAKGLKQVNPRHILTWQIELTTGEEKSLSYVYQVYVRN